MLFGTPSPGLPRTLKWGHRLETCRAFDDWYVCVALAAPVLLKRADRKRLRWVLRPALFPILAVIAKVNCFNSAHNPPKEQEGLAAALTGTGKRRRTDWVYRFCFSIERKKK